MRTGFIGVIGNDLHGELIYRELEKENIDFFGKIKAGQTGYSLILRGESDRTILTFKGLNDHLSWEDLRLHKLDASWMYCSTMLGKSFKTLCMLVEFMKKNNTNVALNMSEYLAQHGLKALSPLLRHVDVLVLNREEAHLLTGKKNAVETFKTLSLVMKGIIVITDGKKPVGAFDGNKIYVRRIKQVRVIEKTGAGDAFASGFVYGMFMGEDINKALVYGEKEALSVISSIGAKQGLLRSL